MPVETVHSPVRLARAGPTRGPPMRDAGDGSGIPGERGRGIISQAKVGPDVFLFVQRAQHAGECGAGCVGEDKISVKCL